MIKEQETLDLEARAHQRVEGTACVNKFRKEKKMTALESLIPNAYHFLEYSSRDK